MICPRCKKNIIGDTRFCNFCGNRITLPSSSSSVSIVPPKKDVRKQWIIGGGICVLLAIIIILILTTLFKTNNIVGTWSGNRETWTFSSDGTFIVSGSSEGGWEFSGTYTLSGDVLTPYIGDRNHVINIPRQITVSDEILTMTYESGNGIERNESFKRVR